jgi:3-dehydroquinate synthase
MPPVATVPVHIPGGASYDITVRGGLFNDAGIALRKLSGASKVAVVTDSHVGPLHLSALEASLRKAEFQPIVATIPAGEEHKTIQTIAKIYDTILPAKIDRHTPVIALGGGVIGDMAGFVAATLLRGVPFVQMPTTLLAMVDASVGGKTGIDHATGKNLIGAFHQPIAVLIDPQVLQTLPPRELRSGLAECIKHEIIRDAKGFAALETSIGKALSLDMAYLAELVAHNVAIKARVVEADPFEKAERAHLNLGHTYGHAIEHVSQYAYSHGESIALGMVAAAYTAANLELIDEAARRRIVGLIHQAGLPTGGMTLDPETVYQAMFFDKKVKAGKLRLVLPQGIGKATIRDDVPAELIRAAIRSLV